MTRRLLMVEDLADLLAVTPGRVRQMRHCGQLPPAIKIGRRLRWKAADIEAWLESAKETA